MKKTLRCALAVATLMVSALAAMSDATAPSLPITTALQNTEAPASADSQVQAQYSTPDLHTGRNEVAYCFGCPAWFGGLLLL